MPELKFRAKGPLLAAVMGGSALLMALPSPANALLMVSARVGADTFTAFDNQIGVDLNPATGILRLDSVTVGSLSIEGSLHTSSKGVAGGALNRLNSSSLSITNNADTTANARFVVGDTDFVGPTSFVRVSGSGTFVDAVGSTMSLFWFNDPQNRQPAQGINDTPGNLVDDFDFTATVDPDSLSFTPPQVSFVDPGLFSMSLGFDLSLVGGGQLISRGQAEVKDVVRAVPEPGTLAVLGIGLAALGFGLRWRHN
jgi:hypothetical protein